MKNQRKYFQLKKVQKRDGMIVPFDGTRIKRAVFRAMNAVGEGGEGDAEAVMYKVVDALLVLKEEEQVKSARSAGGVFIPMVEKIQDIVENEMIAANFIQTAKAFILYRKERSIVRQKVGFVPEKVKELVAESKKYFRNQLAEFVYYRTYSRWIPEENRRETWIETVDRYINFMRQNLGSDLTEGEYAEIREAILKQEAMPSMRLLQFAGRAARVTNIAAFNCSYTAIFVT